MRKITSLPQRKKIRADFWDYSNAAAYFITIVTQNRVPFFGEIVGEQMALSPAGQCAVDCWKGIPQHFPDVVIDEFVVMPDHMHGILIFTKKLNNNEENVPNRFGPQSLNLASVVRGFKVGVTKAARLHIQKFAWQSRYHDRIIRNAAEHERIRYYIRNNVVQHGKVKRKAA
jgi:putative transposase